MTAAKQAQRTPGPWSYTKGSATPVGFMNVIRGRGANVGEVFAQSNGIGLANAEFIVRACNSHDNLLAALCSARDALSDLNQSENDDGALLLQIDQAIERASA